ncbi:peptidylprolyl isomerase [Ancylothrix sp. C2]|uniref:peptidylprolyl isomerase n=1 Tax=Ancylothrix sp. D3o TaxID=2953691 RepID=UPI0021BB50C8|nr:peptidylprolyl isomerase [Ancylothrix sp. D3o]MCT7949616.1 peptidylprolyl isomerase [Ancylothrix sp. D3o]
MDTETFLTFNNQPISLRQAIGYLQTAGELSRIIQTILRQHIIEQQLTLRPSLEIDPLQLEQAIINFRLQNQLGFPETFEEWLTTQNLSYKQFRQQFITTLKLSQLKGELTNNQIEKYFNENQYLLNQVILSRIVVTDINLAEELMRQLLDDRRPFEQLAKLHSITPDRLLNGMMGLVKVGQLPDAIQELLIDAKPGDILGPVEVENRHTILRVEQWQPAILEAKLKQEIQDQLFEDWIKQQLQNKDIKLHID